MNGIINKLILKKPSNKVRVFIILIYIHFTLILNNEYFSMADLYNLEYSVKLY